MLTVDYSVDESPVDSTFRLPDGGVLTIESYSMTGTGTVVVDLARGVPVSGQSTISGGRTLVGADSRQAVQSAARLRLDVVTGTVTESPGDTDRSPGTQKSGVPAIRSRGRCFAMSCEKD